MGFGLYLSERDVFSGTLNPTHSLTHLSERDGERSAVRQRRLQRLALDAAATDVTSGTLTT